MITYEIVFKTRGPLILTEEQYHAIELQLEKGDYAAATVFLKIDKQFPLVQLGEIVWIERKIVNEAVSGVVTPPSPQELRESKEREEANRPVDLNAQLSGAAGELPDES